MLLINVDFQTHDLTDFERRQVPFAIARTLTTLVARTREVAKKEAQQRFVLRRQWMLKGFYFQQATKHSLEAIVGHRDAYMTKQERGGRVTPKRSRYIAVPHRADPRERVRRVRQVLNERNVFILDNAVLRRINNRRNLKLLYRLTPRADYEPRLELAETAEKSAARDARELFSRYLSEALAQ